MPGSSRTPPAAGETDALATRMRDRAGTLTRAAQADPWIPEPT